MEHTVPYRATATLHQASNYLGASSNQNLQIPLVTLGTLVAVSWLVKRTTAAPKKPRLVAAAKAKSPALTPGVRAPLPRDISAQLATLAAAPPVGAGWIHEIKLDGYRLLATIEGKSAQLMSRNGNDWTSRFGLLAEALTKLPCKQAVLDGEAVIMNASGVSSFQKLQNALGRGRVADVTFFAFDLLYLDGMDLRAAPLLARKEALKSLLGGKPPPNIRYSDHVEGEGAPFFGEACRVGLEGIISKRADAPYEAGRRPTWIKTKCLSRQEFVVVGFTEPSGSRTGLGALLLGVYEGDALTYCGKVGTGFSAATLQSLRSKLQALKIIKPSLVNAPRGAEARGVHWIKPSVVAEVAFTEWTDEGSIRHPSFQGLRDDKPARQIVRECSVAAPAPPKSTKPVTSKRSDIVTPPPTTKVSSASLKDPVVAGVRISHPNKVVFPEEGITKIEIARYYEAIAPFALPYMVDRPLTLLRCPNGFGQKCFFQKHANKSVNARIPRVVVNETKPDTEIYLMIDGITSLIELVQMGVMEIHVWGSRAPDVDHADIIVFDLDPGPEVPWRNVTLTALTLRERLRQLGLESFPRFTGGKGLHVVVPLIPQAPWDEVKAFALGVGLEFERQAPKSFSTKLTKAGREDKILMDYLRNARDATAVASLSVRARPGATVAMPVGWDAVEESDSPMQVSLRDAPAMLPVGARDPWQGFEEARVALTPAIQTAVKRARR